MMIYVYQISDTEYGAGMVEKACAARGRIVEEWSVETEDEKKYLERNGSNFIGIKEKVMALATFSRGEELLEEYREHVYESALSDSSALPFKSRLGVCFRLIMGKS